MQQFRFNPCFSVNHLADNSPLLPNLYERTTKVQIDAPQNSYVGLSEFLNFYRLYAAKAKTAEEVAVSILAEIIERRRTAPPKARAIEPTQSEVVTRDPVCGMSVEPEAAKHRAEYEAREYLFCCAGCRTRFLEKPREYATVSAG